MPAATPATPVKPNKAAIREMIKNISAHFNILISFNPLVPKMLRNSGRIKEYLNFSRNCPRNSQFNAKWGNSL
jgi:hypothetical protein